MTVAAYWGDLPLLAYWGTETLAGLSVQGWIVVGLALFAAGFGFRIGRGR